MAEVDTNLLSQEHGSIRHDIAVESARLGGQMGAESCNIRGAIGDVRREGSEHTSDIRYNLAERAGDIRRELADVKDVLNDSTRVEGGRTREAGAEHTGEIIKEGLKATAITDAQIKDARYDLASRIENSADRIERGISESRASMADRFFSVGRDLSAISQGQATLAKDVELNSLKGMIEGQKNTQYLSDKISIDGDKTRSLINDLKYHDLNRGLVERHASLVECESERRHYRDRWDDARFNQRQDQSGAQFAQLQSQLQAFASQLQETRQGMVNFGTMSGQSGQQSSTSNNVR